MTLKEILQDEIQRASMIVDVLAAIKPHMKGQISGHKIRVIRNSIARAEDIIAESELINDPDYICLKEEIETLKPINLIIVINANRHTHIAFSTGLS